MGLNFTMDWLCHFEMRLTKYVEEWLGFDVDGFRYNDWDKEFVCTVAREGLSKLYTLCKMLGVKG